MARKVREVRSNFSSGEISPEMDMRIDVQQYFNGADKIRNMRPLPKGGIKRRPGLEFIADRRVVAGSKDTVRMEEYQDIVTGEEFLLVFTDDFFDVYLNDVLVVSVTPAVDVISLPLMTFYQDDDQLLIFEQNMQPKVISNVGGWTIEDYELRNIPQAAFADSNPAFGTDHIEEFNFVNFSIGDRYTIFVDGHETEPIVADGTIGIGDVNLRDAIEALPNVTAAFSVTVTQLTVSNYTVKMSNQKKFWDFSVGDVNFDDPLSTNILSLLTLTKGSVAKEDAWSATRGWPRTGMFWQNRLLMAGSKSIPGGMWGSRSIDANDFDMERDDDDFGFAIIADSIGINIIHQMQAAGAHIQLFGTEAEFFIPPPDGEILTPTNVSVRRATQVGSMEGVQIIQAFGSSIFLQRSGKALQEFIFDESTNNYRTNSLSEVSSHLLEDIASEKQGKFPPFVRMVYQKATTDDTANYIYIIPGSVSDNPLERNRLLTYSFVPGENINAWTQLETRGEFQDMVTVGDEIYFAMSRSSAFLNPNEGRLIEKFNETLLFDSGVIGTGVATQIDFTWLDPGIVLPPFTDGLEVEALVDGSLDKIENLQAIASGILVFENASTDNFQGGIRFPDVDGEGSQVWIRFMPFESESIQVPLAGVFKRIVKVIISVFESSHIEIERQNSLTFREFETTVLDSGVKVATERIEIEGLLGYDKTKQLELTQSQSLPLHILGVAMEVVIR